MKLQVIQVYASRKLEVVITCQSGMSYSIITTGDYSLVLETKSHMMKDNQGSISLKVVLKT